MYNKSNFHSEKDNEPEITKGKLLLINYYSLRYNIRLELIFIFRWILIGTVID